MLPRTSIFRVQRSHLLIKKQSFFYFHFLEKVAPLHIILITFLALHSIIWFMKHLIYVSVAEGNFLKAHIHNRKKLPLN